MSAHRKRKGEVAVQISGRALRYILRLQRGSGNSLTGGPVSYVTTHGSYGRSLITLQITHNNQVFLIFLAYGESRQHPGVFLQ